MLWRSPSGNRIECLRPESKSEIADVPGFIVKPYSPATPSSFYPGEAQTVTQDELQKWDLPLVDLPVSASTSKREHLNAVQQALQYIKAGKLNKAALARKHTEVISIDPIATFLKAVQRYPGAFVYLLHLPEKGCWLGASPEVLLKVHNGMAQIDSLAGTQIAKQGARSRKWTAKEHEEQAIVSRYIDHLLEENEMRERHWTGPKDHLAGSLVHLQSRVQFNLRGNSFPSDLLEKLHPTPAVCGNPKEAALAAIKELEAFDRELYTGYLGPVHQNVGTALFVNLRCMKVGAGHVEIYAGGGITAASNPEAEWLETEHKCQTMLDLLR